MYLSKKEEKMYNGEYGPLYEWAMRYLAAYGDALKADKLINIKEACLYWHYSIGDLLPKNAFLQLQERGLAVPTYSAGALPDVQRWKESLLQEESWKRQVAYEKLAKKVNITLTATCTPFTTGWIPTKGTHVATVESSLWIYVNSVFGARSHRESFPGVYAVAAVGKTPYAGLHTDEGRKGNFLVKVETELSSQADYDALGYYVGEECAYDIPVFTGIRTGVGVEELKGFGAALSTMGSIGLYHILGITPEAPTLEAAFGKEKPKDVIRVGKKEIKEGYERLSNQGSTKVDYVVLGCPHCTIRQVEQIADLLEGKKVHKDVTFWVLTPHSTRQIAVRSGVMETIEAAGAKLLSGCWTFAVTRHGTRDGLQMTSGQTLVTNSAKCAHYSKSFYAGLNVWFGKLEDCVEAAVTGSWRV